MDTEMAAAAALPDDLLAVVLGRLPARSLATSRAVCKAWHDLIDERKLLLRFLLPHSVRGLFINYQDYGKSHFFSRPTATSSPEYHGPRQIDGKFDFVQRESHNSWYEVLDHCNALVLFLESDDGVLHVCNPTTRWSACLPPCPAFDYAALFWGRRRAFLVFDPFVSPEYKVLLSPVETGTQQVVNDKTCRLMEWPPPAWATWHEFSSSTGRWVDKSFVREGEAAGTAGDLLLNEWAFRHVERPWRYAAYWQGALYIHCHGEYVSRFSLLDDKYRVIKSPIQLAEGENHGVRSFLGRSEKGVYIAAISTNGSAKLRVWILSECDGHMQWVPKDQSNLQINTTSWWWENNKLYEAKYWILDHDDGRNNQDVSQVEQNVCWNSDDDNIINVSDDKQQNVCWNSIDDNIINVSDDEDADHPYIIFLGFHPYKEVIFLCSEGLNAVAFHLNSPKVQYLGEVHLNTYNHGIRESFVYTPCLIGDY